jgi:hypothetical protein
MVKIGSESFAHSNSKIQKRFFAISIGFQCFSQIFSIIPELFSEIYGEFKKGLKTLFINALQFIY